MLHLIKGTADAHSRELLEMHYRLRHDIFVRERGWTELCRPDGREVDDYDTPETVYLLATHRNEMAGGYRFIPTTRPHLLLDHFSHLVEGPVPCGGSIWEWSRFFIRREFRGGPLFRELIKAVAPTCKTLGIDTLTCVIEPDWIDRFEAAGFSYRTLGPFAQSGRMRLAAAELKMDQASLRAPPQASCEKEPNEDC